MTDQPTTGSRLVIFLVVFIDLLGFGLVLPLLPVYAKAYSQDETGIQLGMLMASFSIMQFLFAPFWGKLSDRYGRRPILMVGLLGSVVFYSLFGFATTLTDPELTLVLLFVTRIGAGISGATISTAQAYIADTTTPETRSKGMALIGMAFGAGFTFGPLLGMIALIGREDTPGPWPGYVAAILSAFALCLAIFKLPESRTIDSASATRKRFDLLAFKTAIGIPSIGLILLASFVCIFSFANFETTLSLLIKGNNNKITAAPFHFSNVKICATYSFIGVMLSLVQGGVVRRVSGRLKDATMATGGAMLQIIGFAIMLLAMNLANDRILFVALGIVTTGFAFMQPSLLALLSRRSNPEQQGVIMGVGQSVSSLARIIGSGIGIPLLTIHLNLPYFVAIGLMTCGVLVIICAGRTGHDYRDSPQLRTSE
ncbi:MAG: MFS transporter [Planctomycetaceae bacterium]|jgi:MFS transporter, DHA1 family, tetracycline resistance protein|nr:MFS transporter [Planctomycetaceae bacterium]